MRSVIIFITNILFSLGLYNVRVYNTSLLISFRSFAVQKKKQKFTLKENAHFT